MLNLHSKLTALAVTAVLCVFSFGAKADVVLPALDISSLFGGSGISNSGGDLTIDATAFSIFLGGMPSTSIDIPDVSFTLTATYSGSAGDMHTFTDGSLSAGPYMSATFDSMTLFSLGSGMGSILETQLTYTGGTLISGPTGTMEGSIFNATSDDFSVDFTADTVLAKAGPVVPVPAAVWLFGSGLLGLVGVARRKKATA